MGAGNKGGSLIDDWNRTVHDPCTPRADIPLSDLPDPYRVHLDTKENDQRRALDNRLKGRKRWGFDAHDICPKLNEDL